MAKIEDGAGWTIRWPAKERRLIQRAAKALGLRRHQAAEFVREAAVREAKKILGQK